MDREVYEEACASVQEATLLGFTRGEYLRGPREGLVLVRSSLARKGISQSLGAPA